MARWHSCNVLQVGEDSRHLWQFDAQSFVLSREEVVRTGEPLPAMMVGKSWSSLWRNKLNVAWLPPENVFIRVAHFPPSSPEETRAMVELQLEKLSPIPVTQAVWTMHLLPHSAAGPGGGEAEASPMQTVVVTIAARSAVEEFLGRLEGQRYMADRLEVPVLDQLHSTTVKGDGAWIYPRPGASNTAFVAWWYGGLLQNLDLLASPAGPGRAAGLKDQLMQMAWAGELEGWLTSPPSWHLVANPVTAKEWEPALLEGLEESIAVVAPLSDAELAALTARRGAEADSADNLLPAEFAAGYHQKYVDRLWMTGLGATLVLYIIGCVIYFIAVGFLSYQTTGVEKQVVDRSQSYTNALQIKARYAVLKDRQDLKYAALDCWEAIAEAMPEGLTLDALNFSDGRTITLSGTASANEVTGVIDFSGKLRKATAQRLPLFNSSGGDALQTHVNGGAGTLNWSFGLQLQRGEMP